MLFSSSLFTSAAFTRSLVIRHPRLHRARPSIAAFLTMPTYASAEERRWNRLGDHMNDVHTMFKQEFNTVYELADGSFNERGQSISEFLKLASTLVSHLNMHHSIEEAQIFPILAKRMPEFANNSQHIASHRGIHDGLDALADLVNKYYNNPSSFSPMEMKTCMDGFRQVLFGHLDQEVADLRTPNINKYWTLQELEALPF